MKNPSEFECLQSPFLIALVHSLYNFILLKIKLHFDNPIQAILITSKICSNTDVNWNIWFFSVRSNDDILDYP